MTGFGMKWKWSSPAVLAMALAVAGGAFAAEPDTPTAEERSQGPDPEVIIDGIEGGSSDTPAGESDDTGEEDGSAAAGGGWGVAPIGWGGQVGLKYRTISSSDGTRTEDFYESLQTRASSYIYAPWFAQTSANLHLAHNTNNTSSEEGGDTSTESDLISGEANLQLFPVSRFPFTAYVNSSDSRTESLPVDQDYRSLRYGVKQSYRPPVGPQYYNLAYDEGVVTVTDSGRDVVRNLSGDWGTSGEDYTLGINGSNLSNERDDGQNSRFANLRANHGWHVQSNMNVDSFADLLQSETMTAGDFPTEFDNRFVQVGSNVSWRPQDAEIPLSVHSGVRVFEFDSGDNATRGATANANANYAYTRNLSFNANTLLSQTEPAEGDSTTSWLLGAGAAYRGDPRMLGTYSYNWGTRADASTVVRGTDEGLTTLGAGADHSLGKLWPLGSGDSFNLSLSEAINQTSSEGTDSATETTNLSHIATATYSATRSSGFHGSATLQATDLISRGENDTRYQALALRLDGTGEYGRFSSLSANLSLLWSRLESDEPSAAGPDPLLAAHGSIFYSHRQAFGVRNLLYTLRFTASDAEVDQRQLGDVTAPPDQATYLMENRFTYRLGLFAAHFETTLGETSGRSFTTHMIWLTRDFGAY